MCAKCTTGLGNYLLLSSAHNISIGNKPFKEKRETYTQLRQQQEVRAMTEQDMFWDKEKITKRKDKIIKFILEHF
uniref:GmrSD restriction endonuclease domain-containing protein n=1 Tax=Ornithobacterium rhinotracheale TaxID=28251 RepID=UPI0039A69EFE